LIASIFVDESYGEGSRLMLGGLISSWHKWHGFSIEWGRLLASANVPYAHYFEMDRNKGPFTPSVWVIGRKSQFLYAQRAILQRWVALGLTVSIDTELYRDVYRANFPKRCSPDSAYGVAGKELILAAQRHCNEYFENVEQLNFGWEQGHQNQGNVQQIFDDLKTCYGEKTQTLGSFKLLRRESALPLQAVDQLTVAARHAEPDAKKYGLFGQAPDNADLDEILMMLAPDEKFPVFYHELTEDRLRWHREHAAEMALFKRRAARARG
jgi:hypothetical protein